MANGVSSGGQRSYALLILSGVTAAYVMGFYFLANETQACSDPFGNPWLNFFDRYLACRTLNELGDALAGAFAPVAFAWLAGAVFIQSQELKAQKQELSDTRDVMKQQVAETRASTALFQEQTNMLRQQELLRQQQEADEEFDALLRLFKSGLATRSGVNTYTKDASGMIEHIGYVFHSPARFETLQALMLEGQQRVAAVAQRQIEPQFATKQVYIDRPEFEWLSAMLEKFIALSHRLSPSHKIEADIDEVTALVSMLNSAFNNKA